jgi:arylsulfatase A-like enzyme
MYRGRPLAFRPNVDSEARFRGYGEEGPADIPVGEWTERYFGEITHLDAALGRLLAEVEALGLDDDTIVVFTSDHGDMGGSHGRFEKNLAYEESSRIPLVVRLPGMSAGRENEALFSSVDFLPTLLGLCGLPPARKAEGLDYSPLIRGRPGAVRRECLFMQADKWVSIRSGDVKLILAPDAGVPTGMYRLGADPFEQRNLVADPAEGGERSRLRGLCREWLRDVRTRLGDVEEAARISPGLSEAQVLGRPRGAAGDGSSKPRGG